MAILISKEEYHTLYAIGYSYTKNSEDAQDIRQTVFEKTLAKKILVNKEGYLAIAIHNTSRNLIRDNNLRNQRMSDYAYEFSGTTIPDGYDKIEAKDLIEKIYEALEDRPTTKAVYELILQDYMTKDIAEELNLSEQAIKWHRRQIRKVGAQFL